MNPVSTLWRKLSILWRILTGYSFMLAPLIIGAIYSHLKISEVHNVLTKLSPQESGAIDPFSLIENIMLGSFALSILIGLLLSFTIATSITRPLLRIEISAKVMSDGDLTKLLDTTENDEIGNLAKALSVMQDRIVQMIMQIKSSAESVAVGSAEIAESNTDMSGRIEDQAASLEETAASMEQLSSTVKQNADNARQANQLAQNASNVAVEGGQVVAQVVDTMKGINESSKKISDIISVIDGIAFQTNILALNAAVEAARAGDQGRGFAVVASEVRNLAGRSAEAAREIKSLISASVERVEAGTVLVDKAGATMANMVNSIQLVTDIVGEISSASNEQAMGIAQAGEAVIHMDQATQQNAALVEEMAAAATSLRSQAEDLVAVVARFDFGVQAMSNRDRDIIRRNSDTSRSLASAERTGKPAAKLNHSGAGTDINLDNAIKAHADWRAKLRTAANNGDTLDEDMVGRDDCCELGRWLHGAAASRYSLRPTFVSLIGAHAHFHKEAEKVARTINKGEGSKAINMLSSGTPFSNASSEVGRLIINLKGELSSNSARSEPKAFRTIANKPAPVSAHANKDSEWETF